MKKNKQNGGVTLILLIIAVLVIVGLVIYTQKSKLFVDDKIIDEDVMVLENKNENISTSTTKNTQSDLDIYQNGEHQGTINKVYKNNDGSVFVDVDFFQLFIGKKAFLEHAKDVIYNEENKNKYYVIKEKYPTYLQLEKFIQTVNENDFQSWYNKEYNPDYVKIDYDIVSNVIYYKKNESKKIRALIFDKNVMIPAFKSKGADNEFYDYFNGGMKTELNWDFNFIIKNDIIESMEKLDYSIVKLSKRYYIDNDKLDDKIRFGY